MGHAQILAETTPRFRELHKEMGRLTRKVFPNAKPVVAWNMAAWAVPLAKPPPEEGWDGTMPRTHITIGPTEKKAGITLHFWHPARPYILRDEGPWLKEMGFKPMVGCLQWNRKADFPLDGFERLLEAARRDL